MSRTNAIRARRAQGVRPRRPVAPEQAYPTAIERAYRVELLAITAEMRAAAERALAPVLAQLEAEQRTDAAPADPGPVRLLRGMRLQMERTVTRTTATVARIGEQLDLFNKQAVTRQFQTVLGVDTIAAQAVGPEMLSAFTTEGVELIQSMSSEYFDRIEGVVSDGFARGRRSTSIAKDLQRMGDVTESRAKFIARDQVSKLNGKLTQQRQEALGVGSYIWRASRDSRVRDRHADLDGTKQRWDDPPVVDEKTGRRGHPGEDFQCRCRAEPDIDSLLDELEASDPPDNVIDFPMPDRDIGKAALPDLAALLPQPAARR